MLLTFDTIIADQARFKDQHIKDSKAGTWFKFKWVNKVVHLYAADGTTSLNTFTTIDYDKTIAVSGAQSWTGDVNHRDLLEESENYSSVNRVTKEHQDVIDMYESSEAALHQKC